MEYTGERMIPGKKGLELLELEHRTRYALARAFAEGQRVLDVGTGSGYGAAMLAEVAERVVGTDVSSEAVAYAANVFERPNLTFLEGDFCAGDFADRVRGVHSEPFGLAVCFEVLEHIEEPVKLLRAVRTLLAPDGLLLVSTPNIDFPYDVGTVNPHHVVEYSLDEFRDVLEGQFAQVRVTGQQVHLCSSVGFGPGKSLKPVPWRLHREEAVKYYVALCSNREPPLPDPEGSLITGDAHLKVLQSRLEEVRRDQLVKAERIQHLNERIQEKEQQIDWVQRDREEQLAALRALNETLLHDKAHLEKQIEQERGEASQLRKRLAEAEQQRLSKQLERVDGIVRQQGYFEKRIHELHQENRRLRADMRRQIEEFRNDPAIRRLLRFNALGLKLLGLFGLGHRRRNRPRTGGGQKAPAQEDTQADTLPEADTATLAAALERTRANRGRCEEMALLPDAARERLRAELRKQPQETLVSIIMPTFNRADKIREPVDSVLRQDYKNWELIIVDDGSTDNTREVVAAYQEKHANIEYRVIDHEGAN